MNTKAILIFNCGSSSIKFALINPETEVQLIKGLAERLNTADANISWKQEDNQSQMALSPGDYQTAIEQIFNIIHQHTQCEIMGVGHRVVHGGETFSQPVVINDNVIKAIKENIQLAPLHNPANLEGIMAVKTAFPALTQVAVFDTAFHQTLPKKNYLYPIAYDYYQKYKIRKYGFHGISHAYVVIEAAKIINKPLSECQIISAHLGNGASISATIGGKSVDTSMGFTPLAGLMMGTRCGDIDPGIHEFICEKENKSIHDLTTAFNKQSGLLGISGVSMDMRTLNAQIDEGNQRVQLAVEMFCDRLAKMIAMQAMNLTQIDALVFTGGIGENDMHVRKAVLNQLELLGFEVNEDLNDKGEGIITTEESTVALVIPTNEELMIAKETMRFL